MKRKKKNKKKAVESQPVQSMIGAIIDMPLKDFEEELIKQQVNIGTINNLILHLESMYFELRTRKDAVIKAKFNGTIEEAESEKAVNGLYAEMIKLEQKITYLKQRSKELINVDKTLN